MTLHSDLEFFFRAQLPKHAIPPHFNPVICVDENLNHPELTSRLFPLLKERWLVSSAWYEERQMPDGTVAHISPLTYPSLPVLRMGKTVRGTKWTDEQVLWNIVVQFAGGARVFFLSENLRGDLRGIRRLLQNELAPMLASDGDRGLGLMTLWKKGSTDPAEYAEKALAVIRTTIPQPGYSQTAI